MNKILLSTLVCTCFAFSNETYDLQKAFTKSLDWSAIGNTTVFTPQGEFKIPLKIFSKSLAYEETKDGIKRKIATQFESLLPDGKKSITSSLSVLTMNKDLQLIKFTEKSITDGVSKSIVCLPDQRTKKLPIDKEFKKPLGYISPTQGLACDDGSKRYSFFRLEKGENGSANIVLKDEGTMVQNDKKLKFNGTTIINIENNGKLNSLKSTLSVDKMFKIDFKTDNIK